MIDCHPEETLSTEGGGGVDNVFRWVTIYKKCIFYSVTNVILILLYGMYPFPIQLPYYVIHLLPSLEGDMNSGFAIGRHEFTGWDKSSCLPTNWTINCLLCRKLKHDVIQRRALCRETRRVEGDTTICLPST